MISAVCTAEVSVSAPNEKEIRRYAKCATGADEPLNEVLHEMSKLTYRVSFCEGKVTQTGDGLDLGFCRIASRDLTRAMAGCDRFLVFAATVGDLPDRLIRRYEVLSPVKALFAQAMGAERVEALCDAFCAERKAVYEAQGLALRPRFSPGYGDLPLSLQRDIFTLLDCPRRLALTLNESMLMVPTKSVTALAGIGGKQHELS